MERSKFDELVELVKSSKLSDYDKCKAILQLAKTEDRRLYELFLSLINKEKSYVRRDLIIGIGLLHDSRVLFPLVNLYNNSEIPEKEKIIMAMGELRDPRSLSFLKEVIQKNGNSLAEFALQSYSVIYSSIIVPYYYRFIGMEEERLDAQNSDPINLKNKKTLEKNLGIIEHTLNKGLPQTYVVLPSGFYIGGFLHEHVRAAKGRDVLAAGEVEFDKELNVKYINNRSNG